MAHFKRRRPKNARAGCLMCKPWKANGARMAGDDGRDPISVQRRSQDTTECDDVELELRRYDACECSSMSMAELFPEDVVEGVWPYAS